MDAEDEQTGSGAETALVDECASGVDAYCVCAADAGSACSDGESDQYYDLCVAGEDDGVFACISDLVDADGNVDCGLIEAECAFETT